MASSEDQWCYPTSNLSCPRLVFSFGAQVTLYLVFLVGILVTILGNSVVIISIAHFKQLHSPTNMMVMSLALADLLLGLTVMPFSMMRTVQGCWYYGDSFCLLHSSFDMFLSYVSIYHLVSISIDRHEAICNPMLYSVHITMPVAWIMISASWVIAALYTYGLLYSKAYMTGLEDFLDSVKCHGECMIVFNSLWGTLSTIIVFFFPVCVMVCLYTEIYQVAKKHARRIEDAIHRVGRWANQEVGKGAVSKRSERKAAKTLGVVVSVFIFCWLPFFVNIMIAHQIGFRTPEGLFMVFCWLAYFNSTLNPIIYALFYPWFRKSIHLIVTLKIFTRHSCDMNVFDT
ncbi:trace amine-associated receptor 13c-like [Hypomesus transpacificus]|uniref:trace amine-associated receptor 13c-like n=1 Tax=Hypomesus transpacificus TaxID=137520 RepID=UPI001F079137|nr:trace amine-associated receptor 13c-like [Hypomesus transpacificus]